MLQLGRRATWAIGRCMAHCGQDVISTNRPPINHSSMCSWMVLEHGGGRTFSIGALGWSSDSSMAIGGLVGEAFAHVIAGRLPSPSGCGKGGGGAKHTRRRG